VANHPIERMSTPEGVKELLIGKLCGGIDGLASAYGMSDLPRFRMMAQSVLEQRYPTFESETQALFERVEQRLVSQIFIEELPSEVPIWKKAELSLQASALLLEVRELRLGIHDQTTYEEFNDGSDDSSKD
jgi:hypothetical protein